MNILQIVPSLDIGGVERGVVDFSRYLIEAGHKSVVISSGGRLVDSLTGSGAVHYNLPVHRKSLLSILSLTREVKKIIFKEKIDIVHCRSRVPDWIGFFASLKTPAKFIITAHGYYSVHFFSKIVSLAKLVISPSKTVARHLAESLGVPASKIHIIARGLNLDEFKFLSPSCRDFEEIKVCFLGRISPIKGIEYFIEAINHLLKSLPQVKGFIVGEASKKHKDYELFLRKKVKKSGLTEKVDFLGRRESGEVLDDCHILVLPSLIPESFGRVITEAQAKGVVCIASNLGGPSEIIKNNVTGFLVPVYDSLAISEAVKLTLDDKELYKNIAHNARREVEEKYTLSRMSDDTIKVYDRAQKTLNILVIKLSALGDVILGTATFKTLKRQFPHSRIVVLCGRPYFKILEDSRFIDEIVIYEARSFRPKELVRLSNILRKMSFDIIIDLQNNNFSHMLSFLTFPKKSIGFDRKFGFLLDVRVDYRDTKELDPLESQGRLLDILGVTNIDNPQLNINAQSLLDIENTLKQEGVSPEESLVGINVEASSKWKTKNLSQGSLERLLKFLVNYKNVRVVLTGADECLEKTGKLMRAAGEKVINLCGKTDLKQLTALISKTSLFITPDSAPFHIASSLNIPTIGIFGPTDPKKHAVLKDNVFIVRRKFRCLGCYKKHCKDMDCMDIGLDEFSKIIERLI